MINTITVRSWLPIESEKNNIWANLKAKMYKAGTSGHASIEVRIEKNQENDALVEKYITNTPIPIKEEKNVYVIYWSFYSGVLQEKPFSFGNLNGDNLDSWAHRHQGMNQKFIDYLEPETKLIEPNFLRFLKSMPYLSSLVKIPYFESILQKVGLDHFPSNYLRVSGPKKIEHITYKEVRKAPLMDKLSYENLSSEEETKIINELMEINENAVHIGREADCVYILPLLKNNASAGLALEPMLVKMHQIVNQDEAFDLYGKNCSETTLQILMAGDVNSKKSIFSERGFFVKTAHPYLVADLCQKYVNHMEKLQEEKQEEKEEQEQEQEEMDELLGQSHIEPPMKKVKKIDGVRYIRVSKKSSIESLGRCHDILNSMPNKVPYLGSAAIAELHELLSDDMADFGCPVKDEEGNTLVMDPKFILGKVREQALSRVIELKEELKEERENSQSSSEDFSIKFGVKRKFGV